jgi:hypothetical protein
VTTRVTGVGPATAEVAGAAVVGGLEDPAVGSADGAPGVDPSVESDAAVEIEGTSVAGTVVDADAGLLPAPDDVHAVSATAAATAESRPPDTMSSEERGKAALLACNRRGRVTSGDCVTRVKQLAGDSKPRRIAASSESDGSAS